MRVVSFPFLPKKWVMLGVVQRWGPPTDDTQDLTFEVGPQAHGTLVSEAPGCGGMGWHGWLQNLQVSLE